MPRKKQTRAPAASEIELILAPVEVPVSKPIEPAPEPVEVPKAEPEQIPVEDDGPELGYPILPGATYPVTTLRDFGSHRIVQDATGRKIRQYKG